MPNYRRNHVAGATYFFTVVTHDRAPILTTPLGRQSLRTAIEAECEIRPFEIVAFVLLPEHIHTVWILPEGDTMYSTRWRRIKARFTDTFLIGGGIDGARSRSREKRSERGVWQRRFWEHTVRDEDDLERCLNYIHFNPVKHGLARSVTDYPWSSFHRWVKVGAYPSDWGSAGDPDDVPGAEWE